MATKTKTAHDQLAELDAAIREKRDREAETVRRARAAAQEIEPLRQQARDAWGEGREDDADALQAQARALEQDVATVWRDRLAGAHSALQRAEQQRAEFVSTHAAELLAEDEPHATAAQERVTAALQELVAAYRDANALAARLAGYVRGTHRQPDLRLDALALEVERALDRGVPSPMPEPVAPPVELAAA